MSLIDRKNPYGINPDAVRALFTKQGVIPKHNDNRIDSSPIAIDSHIYLLCNGKFRVKINRKNLKCLEDFTTKEEAIKFRDAMLLESTVEVPYDKRRHVYELI